MPGKVPCLRRRKRGIYKSRGHYISQKNIRGFRETFFQTDIRDPQMNAGWESS
jgi:hypothetical protein